MNHCDFCIVGGGISGLHTAYRLAQQGKRVTLLEARDELGGRIYSPTNVEMPKARFDLGPSWFWPGQSNMERLVSELDLNHAVFQQYAQGDALYEPIGAPIQRGVNGISMQGSYRIDGGLQMIIEALSNKIRSLLGEDAIRCSAPVSKISKSESGITVAYAHNLSLSCTQLVIALPPRVALNTIDFFPNLDADRVKELSAVATWMAGHAKVVITYENPFWRNQALSGDVISQRGPLSEIHDASSQQGGFALFGFFATPPQYRKTNISELSSQVIDQLQRIFGKAAAEHKEIILRDWAKETYTSTLLDQNIPNHHPSNSWSSVVEQGWGGSLVWSGTEAASGHYNGYLEGALIASEAATKYLSQ